MKICCDFCSKLLLPLMAFLFLSLGSLQAQTAPNCDLSKCSPKERAACAKICSGASANSVASLVNLLFEATPSEKPQCQPAACKKTTSNAKLVSTATVSAPSYGNDVSVKTEKVATTEKKSSCAVKCNKAKASL